MCTKVCGWCKIEKNDFDFHKRIKNGKKSLRNECKDCYRDNAKKRYLQNRDKILKRNKEWIDKNKEYKVKYDKEREKKNRQKRNINNLKNYHQRKIIDIDFRIKRTLRARIFFALKNGIKCDMTANLIGCDMIKFRNHIESLFTDDMNWDNYGLYGWHIDHKIPCAKFDLTKEEEQRRCFHYTNLQPLWAVDNLKKGAK